MAESAVRTLLQWIGDDPDREGLVGTPGRVVRAFEDWYSGYREDPVEFLRSTFKEVDGYDEMMAKVKKAGAESSRRSAPASATPAPASAARTVISTGGASGTPDSGPRS